MDIFFILLPFTLLVSHGLSQDTIKAITPIKQIAHEGEILNMSCQGSYDIRSGKIAWYKIPNSNVSELKVSVSTNVSSDYRDRVVVEEEIQGEFIISILRFKKLSQADDGFYKCALRKKSNNKWATIKDVSFEILLKHHVTKMTLTASGWFKGSVAFKVSRETRSSDKVIVYTKNYDAALLTCSAFGALPKPKVKLYMNNKTVSLTSLVTSSKEILKYGNDGRRSWNVELKDRQVALARNQGKVISCRAKDAEDDHGDHDEKHEIKLVIKVIEKPNFKCESVVLSNVSKAIANCLVSHREFRRVRPRVQWIDQHRQIVIPTGNSKRGMTSILKEKLDNETIVTSLEITKIDKGDRLYRIAVNLKGVEYSHVVRVSHNNPTGWAMSLQASLSVLCLCIACLYVTGVNLITIF